MKVVVISIYQKDNKIDFNARHKKTISEVRWFLTYTNNYLLKPPPPKLLPPPPKEWPPPPKLLPPPPNE